MDEGLDPLLELLAEKAYFPKAEDRIRNWFIRHPLAVAFISIIPIFGAIITYIPILSQMKWFLLIPMDILMFLAPYFYPIYKLAMAIDAYRLAKKLKQGKKIGPWEFF